MLRNACPGAGACGGMYTANTMASAIEALGMSLPYSSSSAPADGPPEAARMPARLRVPPSVHLLERGIRPQRHHDPRQAFENATVVLVTVLGGSTNAVLHLDRHGRGRWMSRSYIDDFHGI